MIGIAFKGLYGAAKLPFSGGLGRTAFGMGFGGIASAAMTDYENPNLNAEAIAKGALLGGLVMGPGLSAGKGNLLPYSIKGIGSGLGLAGGGLASAAGSMLGTAGRLGMFAAENPRTAFGLTALGSATGVLAYDNLARNLRSPSIGWGPLTPKNVMGDVDPSYTPEASMNAVAELTGGTGMIGSGQVMAARALGQNARAFMDSTSGLTQGLHRGRHG